VRAFEVLDKSSAICSMNLHRITLMQRLIKFAAHSATKIIFGAQLIFFEAVLEIAFFISPSFDRSHFATTKKARR